MSKRNAIILAALALVAGAGIAALVARHYYRKLVVREYGMTTHYSTNFLLLDGHMSIGPERKARWRWAMREHLERDLRMLWSKMSDDSSWGIAYAILRDPGRERWSFVPEMDDATRNDLIRYLCWRIEDGRTVWGNHLVPELRALSSYPPEALAAHSQMLERAFASVLSSPINDVVYNAQQFLVPKLGQEWADRTARRYLTTYNVADANYGGRVNTLKTFLSWADQGAEKGSRPAQELLGYFVQLCREKQDEFGPQNGLRETAQEVVKRIEAAGWAPPKE